MPTFEIIDGVRRAKAAEMAGHSTIWALVEGESAEQKIRICDLLSPKKTIDIRQPRERRRWINVRDGMAVEPDLLPPIVVRLGTIGVQISEVPVVGMP